MKTPMISTNTNDAISQDSGSGGVPKKRQGGHDIRTKHVLKMLTNTPYFWEQSEFKEIMKCLAVIRSHPEHFPPVMGEKIPDNCEISADMYLEIDWSMLPPT